MVLTGIVWVVIARGLHKASVASVFCAVLFTVVVVARGASWLDMSVVSVIAGIVIVRHLKSLLRVVRGQELGLSPEGGDGVEPDTARGAVDDGR
jgi:glycerol-3-phosphate acyltransferase PlsY